VSKAGQEPEVYLNTLQFHLDRAQDLESGNTAGLTEAEVEKAVRFHRKMIRVLREREIVEKETR